MELGLEGRSALITGGSKGIGYASAYRLAQEGCNVHLDADFPPAEPEEIAAMGAFLASDLSASTTGTVITIDGGMASR